ncbi:MAG: hypothetical protein AVDCRST_MAG12-186, partial [uncultured Rubrobacteraceae bacterium]
EEDRQDALRGAGGGRDRGGGRRSRGVRGRRHRGAGDPDARRQEGQDRPPLHRRVGGRASAGSGAGGGAPEPGRRRV